MRKFKVSPSNKVTAASQREYVKSAAEGSTSAQDNFDDKVSMTEDNFSFAIDGINKIAADGNLARAEELITQLNNMIDSAITEITSDIAQ